MGSYYKHTRTESAKVPYSFRCEQCMKDSGTRQATIVPDGPIAQLARAHD